MNRVALDRVRDVRSEKNISQKTLAARTHYSQSTVSYVEKHGRGSYEQARKIASALGVQIAELSHAGKRSMDAPVVRLGSEYAYSTESSEVGPPARRPPEKRQQPLRAVEDDSEGQTFVLRIEMSEELLERFSRVLGIAEGLLIEKARR